MLSDSLNIEELTEQYRRDQRLRVPDVLQADMAAELSKLLQEKVPYDYVLATGGQNRTLTADEMSSLGREAQRELHGQLMAEASQGLGFLYCGYQLEGGRASDIEELAPLQRLFDFINSEEMLDVIRRITGEDVVAADGQATRYSAGQFLTRHRDDPVGEKRRLAYVFGFTEEWHPDWGGLLQFYEEDGTPRDAWAPRFNTLSLFNVRHIHAVTYVTPFARQPRLSMTGWFRAD